MISIHQDRLAVYLDEVHDDPLAACQLVRSYGIKSVCLRRAWNKYVYQSSDEAVHLLKSSLAGVPILLLSTDVGLDSLEMDEATFERPFLVANYFGARYLRLHIGPKTQRVLLPTWLKRVTVRSILANVVPVVEYNPDYGYMSAQDLIGIMNAHKRWKLVYDPTAFIIRRNLDPFQQYWKVLKPFVAAIDIHDFKIGDGFKPATQGDCRLTDTITDSTGMNMHYILEPGLGRKYGPALTRAEVFKLAYNFAQERL